MQNLAIKCSNLCLTSGNFNIRDLNLEIQKGCITGLIGKNGAGKTTLIQMISDLIDRNSGTILIDGLTFAEHEAEIKKKLSVVYDRPNFNLSVTPAKLVKGIKAMEPWFDSNYFYEKMTQLKLDSNLKIKKYSGGMVKKLLLILALSRRPDILILDEPTSEVDPISRNEMLEIIQEFMVEESHTVLFSTHITSDLDKVADYIVMIEDGRIIFSEEKENLKAKFQSGGLLPAIEDIMNQVLSEGGIAS